MSEMQKVLDYLTPPNHPTGWCRGQFPTNVETILSIRNAMEEVLQEGFVDKLINIDELLTDDMDAEELYDRTKLTYGRTVGDFISGVRKDENDKWKVRFNRPSNSPGRGPTPKWLLVESEIECDVTINSPYFPVVDGENIHELRFRKTLKKGAVPWWGFEFPITETALVRGLERVENPVWVC